MKISHSQRVQIRKLREEGHTFAEICSAVGALIPKSTLSYICKGVKLPDSYVAKHKDLNKNHLEYIRSRSIQSRKQKREAYLLELDLRANEIVGSINVDSLKVALAMLYLGEGAKWRSYRGLSLGSSDVNIIKLYLTLLFACYGVSATKLKARVQYRADQNLEELENYWSCEAGISREQFYKTTFDPRTVGKPTKRSDYRGVCVIMGGGTGIQLELAAIAKQLLKFMGI